MSYIQLASITTGNTLFEERKCHFVAFLSEFILVNMICDLWLFYNI